MSRSREDTYKSTERILSWVAGMAILGLVMYWWGVMRTFDAMRERDLQETKQQEVEKSKTEVPIKKPE